MAALQEADSRDVFWVDLEASTPEERELVEAKFQTELYTRAEAMEIESSSRFLEDEFEIIINSGFLRTVEDRYRSEPITFILRNGNTLITQRPVPLKSFQEAERRMSAIGVNEAWGALLMILEVKVDFEADFIEATTAQISEINHMLVLSNDLKEDLLLRINLLQEKTLQVHESVTEKQRILSSLLKSNGLPKTEVERIQLMLADIASLTEHTEFGFSRLEFLQNTFLGLISVQQNKTIKLFTVITLVIMPPTLIAGIYGMNFQFMPELNKSWGYFWALGLMAGSVILTLLIFKRKRWI